MTLADVAWSPIASGVRHQPMIGLTVKNEFEVHILILEILQHSGDKVIERESVTVLEKAPEYPV